MKITHLKKVKAKEIPVKDINVIEIKVSECNLDCETCSDTEYREKNKTKYSVDSLLQEISRFNEQTILIKGGEPMMYFETPILCNALYSIDKNVVLKTNGTGPLENIPAHTVKIVNYKLPSTGEGDSFFIENLLHIYENDFLKFEIRSDEDYHKAMETARKLAPAKVVFTFLFVLFQDVKIYEKEIIDFFKHNPDLKYDIIKQRC